MELFGILFAVPVTLTTSVIYTGLALALFTRWPSVKRLAIPFSYLVVTLAIFEVGLLLSLGAKDAYAHLRHIYTVIHLLNFFLAPPALANLMLHFTARKWTAWPLQLLASAACCWVACMTMLFGNIMVDEAIVGVDAGKPFYMIHAGDVERYKLERERAFLQAQLLADRTRFKDEHPMITTQRKRLAEIQGKLDAIAKPETKEHEAEPAH